MKFIYGKHDFMTLERAQENCYLLTNGLGGFSSATMAGSVTRNDHAFLMASVKAPNHRYNIVHRLSEHLRAGDGAFWLSSQEFWPESAETQEDGWRHLNSFTFEDCPEWTYQAGGVEIRKKIGMKKGCNAGAVTYEIHNRGNCSSSFTVTPFLQFAKKGELPEAGGKIVMRRRCSECGGIECGGIECGTMELWLRTNGILEETDISEETYYYRHDACDGRRENGKAWSVCRIGIDVPAGKMKTLEILFQLESGDRAVHGAVQQTCGQLNSGDAQHAYEQPGCGAAQLIREMEAERRNLAAKAGFRDPAARALSKSADQFIAKRDSTGGDTVLAGYPFFGDWGRDTMIALPGCCLAVKRYEEAKSILRTFMAYVRRGLMPNLFPEGEQEPLYNTADASLLFINAVWLYYQHTNDMEFIRETYPVMEDIISWYEKGTDYGIRQEEDGLLAAGSGLDQVTWMDVRIGEILPTPRHGKPVELSAYWYNALRILETCSCLTGRREESERFCAMAERTGASFMEVFWMEENHCLKDVIGDGGAECQIRCNQIWAVSLPFGPLPEDKARQVVETVYEKLYTPYGLRTLSMDDREFHPFYGGTQMERDLAYHQGTVWTFPLGGYYLAYLKVNDYSREAKETVRRQLEVMEAALREGCVGQLPEIYDGANPVSSKGCFAQAWSVGEILRVYEALEGIICE